MDRVTRRPLFGAPYQAQVSGLALDGDMSHTYELVGVGSEGSPWEQEELQAGPGGSRTAQDLAGSGTIYRPWASYESQWVPQAPWNGVDKEEEVKAHFRGAPTNGPRRPLDRELWAKPQSQEVMRSSVSSGNWTHSPGEPRKPKPTATEEIVVDTEQIDFQAAREQFLNLERANSGIPPAPQFKETSLRVSQTPKAWNRPPEAAKDKVVAPAKPPRKMSTTTEEKRARAPWSQGTAAPWAQEATPTPREKPEASETPIEREIRLALEREEDLREQRGLRRTTSHQELVQIPSRPPLLAYTDVRPDARPERRRASLFVQRDLAQETQREAEHRRQGLQQGRSPTPDSPPQSPSTLRRTWSSDSLLDAPSGCSGIPDSGAGVRKVNRIPPDAYYPFLSPSTPKSAGVPASSGVYSAGPAQVSKAPAPSSWGPVLESPRKFWGAKEEGSGLGSRGPRRTDGAVVKKAYFLLRPLRFGVPEVPPEEKAPQVYAPQDGAPAWRLHRSQSSELLEKEIENVLRRERELEEERLSALYPEVFSPTPDFCDSDSDSRGSSRASGTMGSYSVSEPLSFTPIRLHSGLVWTAEPPAEASRRKEQWDPLSPPGVIPEHHQYAGLDPSDHVNSEILESTRVPRHKSLLAQRWEAGIYISEDED